MNKKLICILIFIFLLLLGSFSVFADNEELDNTIPNDEYNGMSDHTIEVINNAQQYLDDSKELISYNEEVLRVSASNTTGFQSIILSLLGDYEPIVKDYEYRNNNNQYYSHSIEIQPDYSWIASAAIFAIVLFCIFRLIGSVLSGVFK